MSDHFGDDERGRLSERRDAHLPALMPTGPHFVGPPCDPPPIHSEDAAAVEPPPLPEWRDLPKRVAALEREVAAMRGAESLPSAARTEETPQSGLRITLELTGQNAGALWLDAIPRLVADYGGVPRASVRVVPSAEADAEVERLRRHVGVTKEDIEFVRRSYIRMAAERDDAISERDAALARVGELEKQLPEGMERCTITFHECGKGHGWLSATNWVQHPCQHCERDALKARVAELEEQRAEAEPVAELWAVQYVHRATISDLSVRETKAEALRLLENSGGCGTVVPLFRDPPPPRGWLTREERKVLRDVYISFVNKSTAAFNANRSAAARQYADEADIIYALLARNSPPRVRLPEPPFARSNVAYGDWMMCLEAVKKALAAAGVEVGDE